MTWYVVGSKALSHPKFNLNWREPKDIDIWSSGKEVVKFLNEKRLLDAKLIPQHILDLMTFDGIYATPDTVYTIKCSHLGWNNPAWDKHKSDILHLKSKGCVLDLKLYNSLISFWKTELGDKGFLSLKQDKENFFTDNVNYVYDHDYLHELVAYPEKPVYTKCLKQGEEVLIDKGLFDKLPFEEQVRMFREEITVIAIERFLVNPNTKGKYSWVQAYMMSLKKTITQLTKNWATDFIVLNLEHFVKPDYSIFKHALKQVGIK